MAIEHRLGMLKWHAARTPEQKAATSDKKRDDAVCRLWVRHGRGNPYGRPGARKKMDLNTPIGNSTLRKVRTASVKRILKDLAETRPELFEDCIVAGLQAEPPRSAPYLLAALAYLDGKPVDAEPPVQPIVDLSHLSVDDLRRRALRIAKALGEEPKSVATTELAVIDAQVIPEHEPTLEELQEQVRIAQLEVDHANAEVERHDAVLRILKMNEKQK